MLKSSLGADYVVLGGGNCKKLKEVPPGAQLGSNDNAFVGGLRLWGQGVKGPVVVDIVSSSRKADK
jgi:polyphosphate glucokinase